MTTQRGNVYGFDRAFVWRVNSAGICTGQLDPVMPGTAPLTSHAYEINGPISAELPAPTFGRFEFVGGGAYEGSADAGLQGLEEGSMQSSQVDINLAILLAGGKLDTTTITGGPIIWSTNELNPSPHQVGLMLIRKVQSRVAATAGLVYYDTFLFPLVQMRLRGPNFSQEPGTNVGAATLSIVPQVGSRFPWGEAFGSNQDWYNNQNIWFGMRSQYPWHITAFLQDGVEDSYTLQYLPVYDTITGGRANAIYAVNGVPTAPDTDGIDNETGVVTLAAAGSAGVWDTAFHQTQYLQAS
ncbi:MAG: hypothetical protein CL610_06060 [Anaerolineaceae bacterium]|nr:hypothetical protein [Anaerolineaceae bacterium]